MDEPQFDTKNLKIFNDNAIDNAKSFNFDSYVKSIKKIILYPENKTPFSISINGKWGSGKTSLMKTLRHELNSDHQPNERKVRTVWFNAWKYSNTDNLLAALASEIYQEMVVCPSTNVNKGFFSRLKGQLFHVRETVDIPQQITDLASILSLGKSPDFTKWRKIPEYKKYLPYYVHFQQFLRRVLSYFVLSDMIKEYDDKSGVLVIFIDDLDRCPPKDIATILESVNLFFDQEGCIFVFGMDLPLISGAIEKSYSEYPEFSGKNYIEKLIQLQFNLPEIRDDDIKAFIKRGIADDEPLQKYLDLIISCSGRNPRKIKQFINSLRLMMTLGSVIKDLHIEEELLIKWTLLNFISSEFIDEVKKQNALLIFVQWSAKIDRSDEEETSRFRFEMEGYGDNFAKLVYKFDKDPIICEILEGGSHKFASKDLENYISLSSLTPKEPLVTIKASVDSIILGRQISFSGKCIDGGKKVRLVISGQGDSVVNVATPEVSNLNEWHYTWIPNRDSIQPGSYVARVYDEENRVSDQVTFSIEKGAVTIIASGSQSYYLGEKIKFSGTSTAGPEVYLSIISPNSFSQRKLDQVSIETINNDENTFVKIEVGNNNTWEYEWDTSIIAALIESGTHTIFACEGPFSKDNINERAYGTVSVILKEPFVSATASQSATAQGDMLFITGTATGNPHPGIQIWIFGNNFHQQKIVPVNPDGSYSLKLDTKDTKNLDPGQYYVIIQHPMMNNEFDVYADATGDAVLSNDPKRGIELFSLTGEGREQGADAAISLIDAINSKNIDDVYTKLQFIIVEPKIQIYPIGEKHVGDKFTITATTNLAVGDNVLIQVYSSSFKPTDKSQSKEFQGASGTVQIAAGIGGLNIISFDVDTSTFKPDTYIVKVTAVLLPDVQGTANFKLA